MPAHKLIGYTVVAGLNGGAGIAPGATVGSDGALFEQGARHVGLDIAGKDLVNPTGILLSSVMMLRHLKLPVFADRVEAALYKTLSEGRFLTSDQGGSAKTSELVNAIIGNMQ